MSMRMSQSNRPGYTLLELLLVLALVVIVMAMSVPVMQSMLTDARVTGAGDAVHGAMADARARAMDEGRPWKFGYIPGANIYQIAPEDSDEWNASARDAAIKAGLLRDELPPETYFGRKYEDIMFGSEPPNAESNWETGAIFLADGSARDDAEVYVGKPGMPPMKIALRGITGTVNVYVVRGDPKGGQP